MNDAVVHIIGFSLIIWFAIDRIKGLWSGYAWGKYITLALSIGLGELFSFAFGLDFIYATNLFTEPSVVGKVFTGIILSAGASPIAELVAALKKAGKENEEFVSVK